MDNPLEIAAEIAAASTPDAAFYTDPVWFERGRERVFARTWQVIADSDDCRLPGQCFPTTLLPGLLDEPLLLARDRYDTLRCLSNVCTHRAALLVEGPCVQNHLRCRYHGRRFDLSGRFVSMPEFEGARDFPSPADDLPAVPQGFWSRLAFASLDPAAPLETFLAEMTARVGWLPLEDLRPDPSGSRDYLVRAHWALYVENYLEGFHIPFVHPSLNAAIDYGSYTTELFPYSSLQLGLSSGGDETFAPPPGSPDAGKAVSAYYFWVFPNLMFNFYPWGLSLNIVLPLAPDRTRVLFRPYLLDPSRPDQGAGADLDRVEREDEGVVESVQRGVRARLYRRGRYSPTRETGTHHFHRLLAAFMAETA